MANPNSTVADRVREEMRASMEKNRKRGQSFDNLNEAMKNLNRTNVVEKQADPIGKVRLSTLVPTWDHARGTMDPWVTPPLVVDDPTHIPDPMPWYRPNQEAFAELAYALEYNGTVPTMITGDPSVGKSSLVQYYCSIFNRPFFRFNYSDGLDSTALLGTQKVVATPTGPETVWHDGFVTEALRVPNAIILHDEMTAGGSVLMAYQRLFEKNGVLILNEKPGNAADKIVKPAPNVCHVIADNTKGLGDTTGKFSGTQVMNTATLDRIGTFIHMDFLPRQDEIAMLKGLYPMVNDKVIGSLVKVAELCRIAYRQGNLPVPMSSRVMQSWLNHITNTGGDIKAGARWAFTNRFDDQEDVQKVEKFLADVGVC